MRELIGLMLFCIILAIAFGPTEEPKADRYKPRYEEACARAWKDSGYPHRLVPYKAYLNDNQLAYECQVNVNGRWIPETNVKVGP